MASVMRRVRELARPTAGLLTATVSNAIPTTRAPLAPAAAALARFSAQAPGVDAYQVGDSTNIKWHEGSVERAAREKLIGQKGCVLWFTGLSGSGKSTVAYTLEHMLVENGKNAFVLDGDNIRHGLNNNVGFSAEDRKENIRRIGEVSKLMANAGVITLVSFISPYKRDRDAVRELCGDRFIEVYMKIPLSVCEARDPKGLYKAARAGKIKGFTGIDDPYEEPEKPEVTMQVAKEGGNNELEPPMDMARGIMEYLEKEGLLKGD